MAKMTSGAWRRIGAAALVLTFLLVLINLVSGYQAFKKQLVQVESFRLNDSFDEIAYRHGSPPIVLGPLEPTMFEGKVAGHSRRVFYVGGALGDQNTMPAGKTARQYQAWVYSPDALGTDLVVEFDPSGSVESVTCTSFAAVRYACGPLAGIYTGDSEEKVLGLGRPARSGIEGGVKTIEYRDLGASFRLMEDKVYSMTLKRSTPGRNAALSRYVEQLLP